jgi:hypothetical protein
MGAPPSFCPPRGRSHSCTLCKVKPAVGTWLSLVEHSLGVRGVGSSNLPVPTIQNQKTTHLCKSLLNVVSFGGHPQHRPAYRSGTLVS